MRKEVVGLQDTTNSGAGSVLSNNSLSSSSSSSLSSANPTTTATCLEAFKKRVSAPRTRKGFKSYVETCASLLRRCCRARGPLGLSLHARAIRAGISSDPSVSAHLLAMYSAWGWATDRDAFFCDLDGRRFDLFSCNLMLSARARSGDVEGARALFDRMPHRNVVSWTVMLDAHMKRGRVQDAVRCFQSNPFRSVISWTAMISGFVHNGLHRDALALFRTMLVSGSLPNEITFTCVLRACVGGGEFDLGRSVVGLILKTGFQGNLSVCNSLITLHLRMGDVGLARRVFDEMRERDVVSWTSLLDVYFEMGELEAARRVFDEMPERNEISWSTMIARHSQNGDSMESLRLFGRMLRDGLKPNASCFAGVLSASASIGNLLFGAAAHCHVIKTGLGADVYVATSLVDMYSRCRNSEDGRRVFDMIPEKSIACWNSMISGYSYDGRVEEAEGIFKKMLVRNIISWNAMISGYDQRECYGKVLGTFDDMLSSGQVPSKMTFSSVLHACANLPSLEKGRNLHAKIFKLGIQDEVFMGTALIDMYAKSGDIDSSRRVFSRMPEKNEVSWTAMIQGLADGGFAEESLVLFEEMKITGVAPIEPAIFVSVLFACAHCGLVDKGFHHLKSMKEVYGISPQEKHYTCMVDLLARAGWLQEAEMFIRTMPIRPEPNSWAALLSACSTYKDEEIGERAANKLLELNKANPASYILLSNIYASAGRWKDVAKMRTLMRQAGLKKGGGCSWIQIRDQFHTFFSWDPLHPRSAEIHGVLDLLMSEMTI